MNDDEVLKPDEAAKVLRVCERTLMRHVAAGDIPYVVIGRGKKRKRVRFLRSDLKSFVSDKGGSSVRLPKG